MGFLTNLLVPERRALLSMNTVDSWLGEALGTTVSGTGLHIDAEKAMTSSTVYACINVIMQDVSSLPLITYRRLRKGKERAPEHRLYPLLHDAPNPEMDSQHYRAALVGHMLTWGNAYSEIERSDAGIKGLWPLRPDRTFPARTEAGELVYDYLLPNGEVKRLQAWQVMHWRMVSSNGINGYSPIQQNAEAIGLDLATRKYGAKFFGNDSRPGGILTHPGKLGQDGRARVKRGWDEAHQGLNNAQRVAVLEEGVTWTAVGIPPEQAQFLETRKYTRSEIAGVFRVPPHKIGDLERATFTNVVEQNIQYVTDTLRPILVSIEQSLYRDLFAVSSGKRAHFAEHLVDGLLRGSPEARWAAYVHGLNTGVYSINDVREMENLNPVPDGDVHFVPVNMQTLQAAVKVKPEPEPAPLPGPDAQVGDQQGDGSQNGNGQGEEDGDEE